jgi:hypothetical protein
VRSYNIKNKKVNKITNVKESTHRLKPHLLRYERGPNPDILPAGLDEAVPPLPRRRLKHEFFGLFFGYPSDHGPTPLFLRDNQI